MIHATNPARGAQTVPTRRLLPPALFLIALLLEPILRVLSPAILDLPLPARLAGLVLLLAGLAVTVAADRQFTRARTTVHPFRAPSRLVADGCFRFSRNPMYLGMVAALAGVGLILGSAACLIVPALYAWLLTVRFIRPEERALQQAFGSDYQRYRQRVRRWL